MKLTNTTKWIFALLFTLVVSIIIPGLIAGNLVWFVGDWTDFVYVSCTFGMWLIATAFVDVDRPRGRPDLANRLLPAGLILSVPIAVWDRLRGFAPLLPASIELAGVLIGLAAITIGVSSRLHLGRSYTPRPGHGVDADLVETGLYRWIRHPLYLAAILWVVGWPLMIASILGALSALLFTMPAILLRIRIEERELLRIYGDRYVNYRSRTWRLIPYIY